MGNQFPDRNGAGLEMGGPSRQLRDYSYSIKRSCFGKKKWSYFFFNVEKICTRFDARGDALLVSELVKPRDGSGGRGPGWGSCAVPAGPRAAPDLARRGPATSCTRTGASCAAGSRAAGIHLGADWLAVRRRTWLAECSVNMIG